MVSREVSCCGERLELLEDGEELTRLFFRILTRDHLDRTLDLHDAGFDEFDRSTNEFQAINDKMGTVP